MKRQNPRVMIKMTWTNAEPSTVESPRPEWFSGGDTVPAAAIVLGCTFAQNA
jgi:hypothetical protein